MSRFLRTDEDKLKCIQWQFMLLFHAHQCKKRQMHDPKHQCGIPSCRTMREVLHHLPSCSLGKNCPVPHCSTSRSIILHMKNCKSTICAACHHLRDPKSKEKRKDWRQFFTQEAREQLIEKFVHSIVPIKNPAMLRDRRMMNIFSYARQFESEIYQKADTLYDYYMMRAGKIREIHKELGEKRQLRKIGMKYLQSRLKKDNSGKMSTGQRSLGSMAPTNGHFIRKQGLVEQSKTIEMDEERHGRSLL